MKKGRRPRRRPRLKLSDKAGPDQCPVPGENALFPAQIAGFLAVSRAVPVYPVFLNYVVPVHLAEIRKDHGDNQDDLARKLNVSVFAIRSWEQEKSAPSHEMLVRVCRLYQVSSDYLLGLSNIDPVYEQRRRLEQFSPEELTDLKKYESYLLWKKRSEKNKT